MAKVSVANPPLEGSSQARIAFDTQIKELVETLAGQRGSTTDAAITRGDVSIFVPSLSKTALNAQGTVVQTTDGLILAQGADFLRLVDDVRVIIQDNVNMRNTIAQLVAQLKGS